MLCISGFGTTKTTVSNEQEDHDHTIIDGVKYKIKPNRMYPDSYYYHP